MKQITERNKSILLNPFSEKRKRNIIEELLISKAKCLSLKNSEMIQDKLFINFLKKTDKIKTEKKIIEIEFEKQTIVNNNYELRSPYLEENEIKYVKEPVPYGNPFKLVLRSKTPKMMVTGEVSDEAYLANIIQEKDISKNTKLKGVPKNNNLIETSNSNILNLIGLY